MYTDGTLETNGLPVDDFFDPEFTRPLPGGGTSNVITLFGQDEEFIRTNLSAEEAGLYVPDPDSANGAQTDYTAAAWIFPESLGGDNMVFGQNENVNVEQFLHLGVRNDGENGNVPRLHYGHWGNDTTWIR